MKEQCSFSFECAKMSRTVAMLCPSFSLSLFRPLLCLSRWLVLSLSPS